MQFSLIYTYYEDASHGWLAVPKSELIELNYTDITSFSYVDKNYVYLEEDWDAPRFYKYLKAKIGEEEFSKIIEKNKYHEHSPIRNKPNFKKENLFN